MLRDGRLIQAGSPADVYLAPHDPELARFVGGATSLPGRAGQGTAATCALGAVTLTHPASADDLVLVIRPDQVVLDPAGVEARVDEVSFYGHDAAHPPHRRPAPRWSPGCPARPRPRPATGSAWGCAGPSTPTPRRSATETSVGTARRGR